MNKIEWWFPLDLSKSASNIMLDLKTGDTDKELNVVLCKGTTRLMLSDNDTATLKAKLPNGVSVSIECDVADNIIHCDVGSTITSASGIVECEIELQSADDASHITITPFFYLRISESIQRDARKEN